MDPDASTATCQYEGLTRRWTGRCFLPAGRRGGSVELAVVMVAGGPRRTAGQLYRSADVRLKRDADIANGAWLRLAHLDLSPRLHGSPGRSGACMVELAHWPTRWGTLKNSRSGSRSPPLRPHRLRSYLVLRKCIVLGVDTARRSGHRRLLDGARRTGLSLLHDRHDRPRVPGEGRR
jgi:hypothetical protein